ncbi:lysine N(6)-hydroxylase/L-ornithine N(5)-oxygenase family protein [Mycolicibacterium smegmatis]|uniref:lysine N(6)-hydroxylase/L-ornithine N(5)-oxygenase family protein n=1 Tax=Mycolicibacterium smegmatis TaxID=1772 RepID=UPI0020A5E55C|nr:SidA/IucD/PvdA family monooxygenase [Mycolicibacterium smegmatis]MCP2625689.1 lysine N(6)-hydroxylase/L-ornithine N(5)-oxygenase family protein [Mycolicibacterium smegmatis]
MQSIDHLNGRNGDSPVLDVVGVGFGPSNLALAIAIREYNETHAEAINAEFVEVKPEFGWHTGMLIPGATMQISFLKDLATQRNPTSEFTFLNYLTERRRLTEFINFKTFFPTRLEFHDYLSWAADKVGATVHYGSRVVSVRDTDGAFDVTVTGATEGILRARNVVVAGGLQPLLPPGVQRTRRQIHNHGLLHDLAAMPDPRHNRYVVVGAGQSAAEVCAYLHDLSPDNEVHGVFAKYGYSPADDSPFANRVFDPDAVDDFFVADPAVRRRLINYHRSTNYSAVDLELIEELYAREYAERVAGRRRLFVRGASSVQHTDEDDAGVRVHIRHHPSGTVEELDCDAVIYATGFMPARLDGILGDLYHDLVLEDGNPVVSRDYRLATVPPTAGGLYIQGNTEHTHGLTSSLLSNIAVRSGEILESVITHTRTGTHRLSPVGSDA